MIQTQKDKKLEFFLNLASSDQQLGLVIYNNEKQLDQVKDFIQTHSDNSLEINSLEEFNKNHQSAYFVLKISKKNISSLLNNIQTTSFPAFSKLICVLNHEIFNNLEEKIQQKTLDTFNPIFRP